MWLILTLVAVLSFVIYKFLFNSKKDFWEKYGVRQVNNSTLVNKIETLIGLKTVCDFDDIAYKRLGPDEKYCGVVEMGNPILIVKDLDMLKKLLIKDFEYFVDRREFFSPDHEPVLSKMLASLKGDEWKGVRTSMSPTFTTGKIRRMMEYMNKVCNEWVNHFSDEIEKKPDKDYVEVDFLNETVHLTIDMIAATVFGMDAGTIRNPKSRFSQMAHRLSDITIWAIIKFGLAFNFPWLPKLLGIRIMDLEALTFFERIFKEGVQSRMSGQIKRHDFLQLIVEARKGELKAEGSDELSAFEKEAQISAGGGATTKHNTLQDDDIANAQMLGFFFAGFSTTSNFVTFCVYCLAAHQEVQEKLRKEVEGLFKGDNKDIDYDELNRLPYMEMFICEVLRKYPPLGRLERKCVKEYHDPESGLRVPKNAVLAAPIQSIHNDPEYYEYPDKFYPEHFSPELKSKRNPYAYMPFGTGPRNCIGMRFALVQSKAAVAHIVHNFHIQPSSKTPIPIKTQPVGFGVAPPKKLEIKLSPRQRNENKSEE